MMMMMINVRAMLEIYAEHIDGTYNPVREEGQVLTLPLRSPELKRSPRSLNLSLCPKIQWSRSARQTVWQRCRARAQTGNCGPPLQSSWASCFEHQLALPAQLTQLLSSSWAPTDFQFPAGSQILSEPRLFIWVLIYSLIPACRALLPPVPWILRLLHVPLSHFPFSQEPWLSNLPSVTNFNPDNPEVLSSPTRH